MTAIAHFEETAPSAADLFRPLRRVVATLRDRQPTLAAFGAGFVLLAFVAAGAALADPREIQGVSVWMKPAKFFLSTGVLTLTSAFFFGLVRPERRRAPAIRASVWILVGGGVFELGYIALQGARGEPSHFNYGDIFHTALFALMGLVATAMILTKFVLAAEIARRPADGVDPVFRLAAVLGLALTAVFGLASGVAMGAVGSHAVGPEAGGLPLLGWNRVGGDIRVAHFIGMHAEQAIPFVAAAAAAVGLSGRRTIVVACASAWALLAGAALAQALAGRPFPFG